LNTSSNVVNTVWQPPEQQSHVTCLFEYQVLRTSESLFL